MGFDLLYEEGACLVVGKPAGLLTQAPPGIDSIEARVKQFLKGRYAKPGNVYLGIIHRLDRPVTGAMVFARHVRAARRLCEQFEARSVRKTYWAIVEGTVFLDEGEWRDTMRKVPNEARAERVPATAADAREAVLRFRVVRRDASTSLLEIELDTGRMHQIRLQASSRGHAILGDHLYGSRRGFGPETAEARERAIALHARRLQFVHPMTRDPVDVTAPLPTYWPRLDTEPDRPVRS
ncbi:MAG: RNA pseudouridine synthase [Planctomycetes bacterium]|nr:RNA pseudouridine synthase [Planctomycetota bacterium]